MNKETPYDKRVMATNARRDLALSLCFGRESSRKIRGIRLLTRSPHPELRSPSPILRLRVEGEGISIEWKTRYRKPLEVSSRLGRSLGPWPWAVHRLSAG